jgi:hypothetical protein
MFQRSAAPLLRIFSLVAAEIVFPKSSDQLSLAGTLAPWALYFHLSTHTRHLGKFWTTLDQVSNEPSPDAAIATAFTLLFSTYPDSAYLRLHSAD